MQHLVYLSPRSRYVPQRLSRRLGNKSRRKKNTGVTTSNLYLVTKLCSDRQLHNTTTTPSPVCSLEEKKISAASEMLAGCLNGGEITSGVDIFPAGGRGGGGGGGLCLSYSVAAKELVSSPLSTNPSRSQSKAIKSCGGFLTFLADGKPLLRSDTHTF